MSAQATTRGRLGRMSYLNAGPSLLFGDVVVLGSMVGVVVEPNGIAAGSFGPIQIDGLWDFVADTTVWAAGDTIYWNPTGNPIGGVAGSGCATSTASGGTIIGPAELAKLTGGATGRVLNTSAQRTATIAGAITASDITGSDASLGIFGNTPATVTSAGGAIALLSGIGGATSGAGGEITITGGAGTAGNSAGGAITDTGGAGQGSAAGGAWSAIGGAGGDTGTGGAIAITSGAGGATSGAAGAIAITVGSATSANGSSVTVTAGSGAGGTNAGGSVNLVPGAAASTGIPGEVQVNGNSALIHIGSDMTATDATRTVFIATRACRLKAISAVFSTASSSGTLQLEKCTGTQAPGSGSALLTGTVSLAGTANTVVSGTLVSTVATITLAAGDRISLVFGGTLTNLVGGFVDLSLAPC